MLIIFEAIVLILKITWFNLVGIFRFFVPPTKKSLVGEIVLITGAGSGIGRLMAINFAKHGCTLVLWDIDKDSNDETTEIITALGGKAYGYRCDVTNKDEVYRLAEQIKEYVGSVTILVNNAGVVAGKNLLDCPDELILRSMNVNVISHFWTLKAFAPSMVANNHGHIVTISSICGVIGAPGMVEYCASKFAAVGLHESLCYEFIKEGYDGIKTTLVQPYLINTGMFDGFKAREGVAPPDLDPQYVADMVLRAVQTNQDILMMPRPLYLISWFKSWMSLGATVAGAQFTGAFNAMDTFVGRQKKHI
ncbi:retinol dehydrogenase 10-B-like [Saccoglossus kowalevskii]|uniref:Retinol dehydrogenase 10-B-like n=1 Tax=Saccoglossus kowalevskii TaxID=10224 RepID=A0ABM0GTF1_SACKO|nr:PREDICTED: retinol dehydrogenase 10-B-like [Saccoglossus kowalevskii]